MTHPYTMTKQEQGGNWYWDVYDPAGRCIAKFPVHYGMEDEAEAHAAKFFGGFAPWEF